MTRTQYRLDRSARRLDDGRVLLGGSPLTLFRLSERGAAVLDALLLAPAGAPASAAGSRLVARLVDAGALHPLPGRGPWRSSDVTVVVPAYAADLGFALPRIGPVHEVIVVDDGSDPPLRAPRLTSGGTPVRLVRRTENTGPAAARNTGLAEATTPLVAFVDTDCRPEPRWLEPLLAQLGDPDVALVAPRVRSLEGLGLLARYEAARSPLDLGDAPGRVRAGTRVSYVPAATLLGRADALRHHGGFDETMRVGEDVDLVWRLDEAGAGVRYEPAAVVRHRPRPTLRRWLAQRVSYGASAAALARRHPGAPVPVAVSAWSAATWALAAAGHPMAGMAIAATSTAALTRKLSGLAHPGAEAVRLAGWGHLHAGRQLAAALTRVWWPVALLLALRSRRARRALALAALVPALTDWWQADARSDELGPVSYLGLRLFDDGAYGAGVWLGVWRARTAEPLLPDLTSWPRASRYQRAQTIRSPR